MKDRSVKIGKYNVNMKLILLAAAVIILIIALVLGISHSRKKKAAAEQAAAGYTFDADAFEDINNIECIDGKFCTYADASGKKGLMTLDGTITEEADEDAVYIINDAWRSYRYVCEGPRSEYRLLIDPETATIGRKQYNGVTSPEVTVQWSTEDGCLVAIDSEGKSEKVAVGDYDLEDGLYPVCDDKGNYGYMNENLELEIALMYQDAKDFSEGIAAVEKDGKWGYINESGVMVVPFAYDEIGDNIFSFENGLVPAKKDGLCGLVNKEGEHVTSFDFEALYPGKDGKYIGKKDGQWGIMTVNADVLAAETTTAESTTAGASVDGGNYIVVTAGSSLRIRASADASSAVVGQIPNGTVVTVSESVSGWAHITYSSCDGWISTDYIAPTSESPTDSTSGTASETAAETEIQG